ncbi:AraC family ligand binding domain-containing protein [Psychrobium sp. nBUS_13]|uniref:AraC family ligand binding domain-containing protein n=1 Tax=Psychrobium sp. nBUS_13 TaxID=3395319 RepID=UPI003EBE7204
MTDNIEKQTMKGWVLTQRSKHRKLTHPIMPVRRDMDPMVQVVKHSHTWGQLVYASQGVIQVIADDGRYIIPPGQALWLPSGVEHQVSSL